MKKTFRIYGLQNHRQRVSFGDSKTYDWSKEGVTRRLELRNADLTGTNLYSELTIERDGEKECYKELCGQITDGLFEDSKTGKITELIEGEEIAIDPWSKLND